MTQLPSWGDGFYFLFGGFLPYTSMLLVFLNLFFLGTCYIFFPASVGAFSGSLFFMLCLHLILGAVTTEIRFFALVEGFLHVKTTEQLNEPTILQKPALLFQCQVREVNAPEV